MNLCFRVSVESALVISVGLMNSVVIMIAFTVSFSIYIMIIIANLGILFSLKTLYLLSIQLFNS